MTIPQSFKPYESKPITRYAHRLTAADKIAKVGEATYNVVLPDTVVAFKAYEEPHVGDFIVWLSGNDIYHCTAKVFAERNIIP